MFFFDKYLCTHTVLPNSCWSIDVRFFFLYNYQNVTITFRIQFRRAKLTRLKLTSFPTQNSVIARRDTNFYARETRKGPAKGVRYERTRRSDPPWPKSHFLVRTSSGLFTSNKHERPFSRVFALGRTRLRFVFTTSETILTHTTRVS